MMHDVSSVVRRSYAYVPVMSGVEGAAWVVPLTAVLAPAVDEVAPVLGPPMSAVEGAEEEV